jgi:PAS domain S-box-containing protein
MSRAARRLCAWSAAATVVTAVLAGAYLAWRGAGAEVLARDGDLLLLAAAVAGVSAAAVAWAARRRYRTLLHHLGSELEKIREGPSRAALAHLDSPADEDLAALVAPLEALGAAYRRSLADRVAQAEALESLRGMLGRADAERGPSRTVLRGSGSSRNMVARLTPGLHWMTATAALQQFLGRTLAELNSRPFEEVVPAEDVPALRRAFDEALDTGEAHNVAFRVLARDLPPGTAPKSGGSDPELPALPPHVMRHVQMDVMARYSDDGQPLHLRCHLADIGDRVRAEEALRRRTDELLATNERLRAINADLQRLKESYSDLYHNAPVMYFSLDAQGHLVTFNHTMLRALGYERDELLRQPYTRLLAPEGQRRFLQDPGAYQKPGEVETHWVKCDGTVIDVWIRGAPLLDKQGRFVRSRSVAQDVTERNRLANELRRRRDELERANATLRRINNELDEFTSVVSHDLKEPLRTLEAYSKFLAQEHAGRLGPDGLEYLNHLVRASRRFGDLIDDLLTLSLAGRVIRVPAAFRLGDTARTVCADLADLVRRKRALLRVAAPLPAIIGDEQRVTQLLANLIGNGLKYNTSARPEVIVGELAGPPAPAADGRARYVTLYVRDNGIGIAPVFHEEVFGIFRRLHGRDQFEGTGAGLAICKKVVEAHGGRIWVESEPGRGATFFFTLPWAPAAPERRTAVPAAAPKRRTEAPATARPAVHGGKPRTGVQEGAPDQAGLPEHCGVRILLVEDLPEIGLIVQRLGRHAGYAITWLTTAEKAWDHLQQESSRPDLLLLDIHLPGMSGVELCRRLRSTPALARLKVALFSQVDRPEAVAAGRDAGANFVLSKALLSRPAAWQRRLQQMLAATQPEAAVP